VIDPFELATATRVVFGAGKAAELPALVAGLGARKALVVGGRARERTVPHEAALAAVGIETVWLSVPGEPTLELAREGVALCARERCDAVVGIGGGSALDAAKAIAALATNPGDPLDYLEVIGQGRAIERAPLPLVAVPTTAGTGSEVTRNAVLSSAAHRVKASLRSPLMLPRVALVDPELVRGVPAAQLASSGLDALSQLIEPYLSCKRNPVTDALAREGIPRSARSLRRACLYGPDAEAREDLALASLLGGLCLANAGLGAVHGFAAPAGGMLGAPHGALCAALLVAALDVNLRALRARAPEHPALPRLREVAALLTGAPDARAEDGIAWLDALVKELRVPGLAACGLATKDVPELVAKAKAASSMKGNPLPLTDDELTDIAVRSM
jgi:alcohol dehydrogenase class IV